MTPIGIAKVLGLSPKSTEQVERGSARGIFQSATLTDANPTGKRERFLDNVVQGLKPIILKVCSIPKFVGGKEDAVGVSRLILGSIINDGKPKRPYRNPNHFNDSKIKRRKLFVDASEAGDVVVKDRNSTAKAEKSAGTTRTTPASRTHHSLFARTTHCRRRNKRSRC